MSFTWTILAPSLFFTNDLLSKGSLLNGKSDDDQSVGYLLHPLGRRGCSRVDVADIALAVQRSIEDGGRQWNRKKIYLGSLKWYTETETAQIWSAALGKPVDTASAANKQDLLELEKSTAAQAGPAWARDVVLMVEHFDTDSIGPDDEQYQEQVKFLGKEPSSYEAFVKSMGDAWKKEARV